MWAATRERIPEDALDPRALSSAIANRSDLYTRARERLPRPIPPRDRARDLAARALFFTIADAAKVLVPLAELAGRGLFPSPNPLRVLDVGAGVGAMTLGLAAAARSTESSAPRIAPLVGRRLDVLAVDRDPEALALFQDVARRIRDDVRLELAIDPIDVTSLEPPGSWDLILLGTLLNELDPRDRIALIRRLLGALDPHGALILIEPALRETARALHELRDALLAAGDAHVFAPCTRRAATCPALVDERDWCHEDRPFDAPPRLAQLSRNTGLRREGLKFAYLTLRRARARVVEPEVDRRPLRVVSGPLDQKGTVERLVCGDEGRFRLRVLRRRTDDAKHVLGAARRGDVVVATGDESLARVRPADDGVEPR